MKHPVLYGEYDLSIDEKGRLTTPAEVRRSINPEIHGDAFFMVVGRNRKIWIYVERYYEALANTAPADIVPGLDMLAFDQLYFSLASRLEPDKAGRVLIPEKTLKRLGIKREVTMVGVRDHLEIWNREDWEAHRDGLEQQRPEIEAARQQYRNLPEKPPETNRQL